MRAFLTFLANNTTVIFWLIVIAAPVVRAIVKALGEQKRKRDAMLARHRAESEALRTGRPVPSDGVSAEVSAKQRLEEIAARRRQQVLEAQRARAASGPPPLVKGPAPAGPRVTQVRLPGGIVLEIPEDAAPAPKAPPSPPPRRAEPQRRRSSKDASRRQAEEAARQAKVEAEREDQELHRRATALAKPAEAATSLPTKRPSHPVFVTGRLTRADWRRAIVLQEILGRPVGSR